MGNTDSLPVVSQAKSVVQLVSGDTKGAARTAENFFKECPGVSQVTSVVQLACGDSDGALETQKRCGQGLLNAADGLPVVGHTKGLIHYAVGDKEGGHRAMKAATRSTGVMAAGAAGFLVAGPVGAVAMGIEGGMAMDVATTAITGEKSGYVAAIDNCIDNPSAGAIFDTAMMPVFDGVSGYGAGKMVQSGQQAINNSRANTLQAQADGILNAAEANKGSMTSGQYLSEVNRAQVIFEQGEALRGVKTVYAGPKDTQPTYVRPEVRGTFVTDTGAAAGGSSSTTGTTETDKRKETRSGGKSKTDHQDGERKRTRSGQEGKKSSESTKTTSGDRDRDDEKEDKDRDHDEKTLSDTEEEDSDSATESNGRRRTTTRTGLSRKPPRWAKLRNQCQDPTGEEVEIVRLWYSHDPPAVSIDDPTVIERVDDIIPLDIQEGTTPNPSSVTYQRAQIMSADTFGGVKIKFVAGHMVSQRLGGVGDDSNMAVMTASCNGIYFRRFEKKILEIIKKLRQNNPKSQARIHLRVTVKRYIRLRGDSGRVYYFPAEFQVNVDLIDCTEGERRIFDEAMLAEVRKKGLPSEKFRPRTNGQGWILWFDNDYRTDTTNEEETESRETNEYEEDSESDWGWRA